MPKSKNRRKNGKKSPAFQKNKPFADTSSDARKAATAGRQPGNQADGSSESKRLKRKVSLQTALYRDQAEGLRRVIRFLPLFSGAWVAGGFLLTNAWSFVVSSVLILLSFYSAQEKQRQNIPFPEVLAMLLYAAMIGLGFFLFLLTESYALTALTFGVMLLVWLSEKLPITSTRAVLLLCFERVVEMSLFSFLSVYSQIFATGSAFYWEYCVLGFVPGCVLAAAYIALYSELFAKAGWNRSVTVGTGEAQKKRPGATAQIYSLFLLAGPSVPVALTPLGVFPMPFLALSLVFIPIPKLCQTFLEQNEPDSLVFVRTLNIAALLSLAVLLVALAAKFFF